MNSAVLRNTAGLVRLATAFALIYSIGWQIQDRLIHNVFRPGEYFAYFTIDSAMIAAVTLAVAGVRSFKGLKETELLAKVRLTVVSVEVVVGVVYNALLRDSAPAAEDVAANYTWPVPPNEILHVWAPILIALDFVLLSGYALKPKQIFNVLLYPLAWLLFSIGRGFVTDWWAYWFLNPNDPGGISQMVEYIFGIMAFLLIAAALFRWLAKLVSRG